MMEKKRKGNALFPSHALSLQQNVMQPVAAPEFFFSFLVGDIKGAKYVPEGAKIKNKLPKIADFCQVFLLTGTGGQVEGRASKGGGAKCPLMPPPLLVPPLKAAHIKQGNFTGKFNFEFYLMWAI